MCKCCEDIQFIKKLNKTDISNIKHKLKATITSISIRKGEKGIAGRVGYGSYNLNYCPMCRKEINIVDKEEINPKTFEMIDNKNIKSIEIRTIGLLDVFGKIEIDITFENNSQKHLVGISPVDTEKIKEWLESNNLYEKAKMYSF